MTHERAGPAIAHISLISGGPSLAQSTAECLVTFPGLLYPPFKYRSKNTRYASAALMLFSFRRKPWPSSGKTMYSTGTLLSRTACTISSLSALNTRGSLAP
jgi:hypothetical protein